VLARQSAVRAAQLPYLRWALKQKTVAWQALAPA